MRAPAGALEARDRLPFALEKSRIAQLGRHAVERLVVEGREIARRRLRRSISARKARSDGASSSGRRRSPASVVSSPTVDALLGEARARGAVRRHPRRLERGRDARMARLGLEDRRGVLLGDEAERDAPSP